MSLTRTGTNHSTQALPILLPKERAILHEDPANKGEVVSARAYPSQSNGVDLGICPRLAQTRPILLGMHHPVPYGMMR